MARSFDVLLAQADYIGSSADSNRNLLHSAKTDEVRERVSDMSVQRYDPFPNAISLRSMMDRLMDESFLHPTRGASTEQMLPIDVAETDDAYEIRASIPGIDPEHLQITVQDNMVTIRGDSEEEQEKQGRRYLVHERRMGHFERTFMLPNSVDADKADAKFENGVLALRLSKSESAKPKQIKIGHP